MSEFKSRIGREIVAYDAEANIEQIICDVARDICSEHVVSCGMLAQEEPSILMSSTSHDIGALDLVMKEICDMDFVEHRRDDDVAIYADGDQFIYVVLDRIATIDDVTKTLEYAQKNDKWMCRIFPTSGYVALTSEQREEFADIFIYFPEIATTLLDDLNGCLKNERPLEN